jgi:hypothetical protein
MAFAALAEVSAWNSRLETLAILLETMAFSAGATLA